MPLQVSPGFGNTSAKKRQHIGGFLPGSNPSAHQGVVTRERIGFRCRHILHDPGAQRVEIDERFSMSSIESSIKFRWFNISSLCIVDILSHSFQKSFT
jgi:hypothetical protein